MPQPVTPGNKTRLAGGRLIATAERVPHLNLEGAPEVLQRIAIEAALTTGAKQRFTP